LFVDLLPENHATLFHRLDESPLPDREWCADPACESPLSDMTARDTRTICSSPRYTCCSTRSTLREMLSYDGVLRCVGLTLAALPLNMEVNPTDAAPVGDTPFGDIDGGDLGGRPRPASWDLCLT
jgi:hypothetical protein